MSVRVFLKNNPNENLCSNPTNKPTKKHPMKYLKWTKMKFRIQLHFIESIMGYRLQELLMCCFLNASSLFLYCRRILFYGMFCELYDHSLNPAPATLSNYCYLLLHNSSVNSSFYFISDDKTSSCPGLGSPILVLLWHTHECCNVWRMWNLWLFVLSVSLSFAALPHLSSVVTSIKLKPCFKD